MAAIEKTYPCIEVYERADEKFAWRLRAANQQIIATDGGQGYDKKADAVSMADRIIRKGEFVDVSIWQPAD